MPWFQELHRVKRVDMQNSTHMPMFEEPKRYFNVLIAFLCRDGNARHQRPTSREHHEKTKITKAAKGHPGG
ncbi:hypothetical protein BDN71DRAFT_1453783 [Pleurotus eryngii]|uniref:Uncharacterized protein n=1 Tax=Pleurotus eryngii TaxID=5323 RepID=A0A9P5ZQI9_PLEER|nr:hypothetical protein BDN71DRAFT_1453783 [Pleurotus eryngii]